MPKSMYMLYIKRPCNYCPKQNIFKSKKGALLIIMWGHRESSIRSSDIGLAPIHIIQRHEYHLFLMQNKNKRKKHQAKLREVIYVLDLEYFVLPN